MTVRNSERSFNNLFMMDHRDGHQRDYNNSSKWEQLERERERDREYGRRNEVDNYYY
jgi:hypothetical protein